MGAERQGFKIATKIFPNARSLVPAGANPVSGYHLSTQEGIKADEGTGSKDSYTLEAADVYARTHMTRQRRSWLI